MAVGLFNPKDNANATSTRPAHVSLGAAVRRWFTDSGAGTRIHAQDLNAIMAQFRAAMDAYGITDEEADDTVLTQLLTASLSPRRNYVRNGDFRLWQAGTSFTSGYLADLWKARTLVSDQTYSRQAGFSGARYCLRNQRTAGSTSTSIFINWQVLETAAALRLAGKKAVISFDVRCGANFSGGNLTVRISSGTSIESTPANGAFSVNTNTNAVAQAPTTTAQRLVFPLAALPTDATEMAMVIIWTPSGTAGANDWVEITNIKVEEGSIATAFVPEPMADILAAASRFYQKTFNDAVDPAQNVGQGTGELRFAAITAGATTQRSSSVRFAVPMRAAPTVTLYNPAAANGQVRDLTAGADCSTSAVGNITEKGFSLSCVGNASTAIGNNLGVHWVADGRTW